MKKTFILVITAVLLTMNTHGQFGKNIVQYKKFNWKYIQTEHFDIYYNKGSKYLAEFTAFSIEDALASVQKTLNFRINKKIKLIVYDTHNEFQQTNVISQFMSEGIGGVTELAKNRMVVPFQGDFAQFDHVLHHELVHAVMNQMYYGGTFQSALKSGNLGKVPIWISEGIAEYESIGGYNVETDMFMRDIALNEKLIDLKDMNNYFAYRGGQTFFWYVAEKYGHERVGDFINRLKLQKDIQSTFESSFNMTLEEFSEEFRNDLKEYYWPDIAKFDNPKEFAERLTNHEKERSFYNSSPAISPDGKKMAYISAPGGLFSIMVRETNPKLKDDENKPEKIVSSFREQDFEDLNVLTPGICWNPEGTKLAISAKSGGEDAIFIVDVEEKDYKKILPGINSISSVNWSPDGNKLVFIGSKLGQSDLYTYTFTTQLTEKITDDVFSDKIPIWGHNSKFVYFISDRGENIEGDFTNKDFKIWTHDFYSIDIYRVNTYTGKIERLTYSPDVDKTSLAISSDDKNLFFTADNNGISNIYNMDLSSKHIWPITNSQNEISQITISKDNSKMLFTTMINGGYDIYMMRFPQEVKLENDTLPVTKYKTSIINKNKLLNEVTELKDIAKKKTNNDIEKIVYGNFEIDFKRQKVINENPDAADTSLDMNELSSALSDTTNFIERDYKISFSPDFISANPGYNTFWGFQSVTQMLFSDDLGDHQIMVIANILDDINNSTLFAAYFYRPEIIDYSIAAYHTAGYYQHDYDEDSIYRFRDYGTDLMASYPLDLFNRIEWGIKLKNISKESVFDHSQEDIYRFLFIPQSRFVHDDVLYGMFSPITGRRFYVGFMGTPKFSDNGIGFLTINGDYREYFKISEYSSIAIRGAAGMSLGPNPQSFYLGGTDNWINRKFNYNLDLLRKPEDFAFINSSFLMPLRGWDVGAISGERYFMTNVEFRFPFIGWFFATPIPLAQTFFGAVFVDIGGAWDGDFTSFKSTQTIELQDGSSIKVPNHLLMSTGVGLRTGLLGLPLKIDVAWTNLYHKWSEPKWLFSLGFDW